jgi:hypothetical protein
MDLKRVTAAALLCGGAVAIVVAQPQSASQAMAKAAKALIASVDQTQAGKLRFPFASEERFNWHFIPRTRLGLPLKEMTQPQRDAALALLKTGLSASGYQRADAIRSLELVLRAMEKRDARDPEMYFFTVFGNPGDATWGWRYEGHHVSQNWTIARGKAVATTPAFFGANPAEVRDGPQKGTRALPQEADLAWNLLEAMSAAEKQAAVVSEKAPSDIITMNSRTAAIQENTGLAAAKMSAKTRALLMGLIEAHAGAQQTALAAERMAKLKAAGVDAIVFAWMGTTDRAAGGGHYYRIQGPTFLIEYDNTQNGANHQHIVWRDFKGDFGDDLLAAHYAAVPHRR